MRDIVLLTDYGNKDPYAGILKAVIYSICPAVRVIDLCHDVMPQNIAQASDFLQASAPYFSRPSIFVCVVDPGVGTSRKLIAISAGVHFFLAPDNGLLEFIASTHKKVAIRQISNKTFFLNQSNSNTFHGRDILAPVAARLAKQPDAFDKLGPREYRLEPLRTAHAVISKSAISGNIVYFDHFGNAITNIKKEMAGARFWQNCRVSINSKNLGKIQKTYHERKDKKLICLLNSSGRLEIAAPSGSAERLTKLKTGDKVITAEIK